jgi:hypothetical protein
VALTWDDVTGKVNKHIIPRLVDNVYKSSPVFTRLRTRNAERFEGGTSLRHPIAYAELNGAAFQRGGTFNITYVQTDTALEVVPKYYYVLNRAAAQRCAGRKPSLIGLDAGKQTRRKQTKVGHRDRLSERAPLAGDAIVGPCGNRTARGGRNDHPPVYTGLQVTDRNVTLFGTDNVRYGPELVHVL